MSEQQQRKKDANCLPPLLSWALMTVTVVSVRQGREGGGENPLFTCTAAGEDGTEAETQVSGPGLVGTY